MRPRQRLILGRFRSVLPLHSIEQDASIEWLARLHATKSEGRDTASLLRLARRHACGPDRIERRWHEVPDFAADPSLEGLLSSPLSHRMAFFGKATRRVLREMYPDGTPLGDAPDELLHVTCTGYASPSAAQLRVSELGWGGRTRVTHAYHMGCHAAFPALRMAAGAVSLGAERVDVFHGEICSLHVRPGAITPEQWVIQSLFADGFVRYSLREQVVQEPDEPALDVLSIDEILAPATADQMTWTPAEDVFAMTLSKGVPREIGNGAGALVDRLLTGLDAAPSDALFAVHPGGPRVLEAVAESLHLTDAQLAHSHAILRARGNMSSATLPMLWHSMLADPGVPDGTIIVTLGFGPGLTLAGAVLRVVKPTLSSLSA